MVLGRGKVPVTCGMLVCLQSELAETKYDSQKLGIAVCCYKSNSKENIKMIK